MRRLWSCAKKKGFQLRDSLARRALVRAQAGEELTDDFAGKSADDVEQQIVQMLGAAAVDEGVPPGDMVPADQRRTLETPEQAVARLQKELAAKDEQHERELAEWGLPQQLDQMLPIFVVAGSCPSTFVGMQAIM